MADCEEALAAAREGMQELQCPGISGNEGVWGKEEPNPMERGGVVTGKTRQQEFETNEGHLFELCKVGAGWV